MTTDLHALTADLEKAPEGSRDLSDRMLLANGWIKNPPGIRGIGWWQLPNGKHLHQSRLPDPSRSVDAALQLVPEGWDWMLFSNGVARLYRNGPEFGEVCRSLANNETPRPPQDKHVGASESGDPALALCAAICRALMESG